jgi:hypothetical protein
MPARPLPKAIAEAGLLGAFQNAEKLYISENLNK